MRESQPARTDLLLLGGGHSHVAVLRSFGMQPLPGVRLTLVATELNAPYSGMLPGLVAGHYRDEECHIDLVRLARFAGARLVNGEAVGIDRNRRQIALAGRPPLAYDLLSIDVGITPDLEALDGASENALVVKPISTFIPRWRALEGRVLTNFGLRHIAVLGGGAAGFELVLAIRHRLIDEAKRRGLTGSAFRFALITGGSLLPTLNGRTRALARAELAHCGVELIEGQRATRVSARGVELASGRSIAADSVVVATRAAPPSWLTAADLPRDARGFVAVRPSLQLLDDDDIFAVGDCASVIEHPREKAGVFAVRQGPPLGENLRRRASGQSALPFVPQQRVLKLLSLGTKRAIASRGPITLAGDWVWRWKDSIDRRFMERYNDLPRMNQGVTAQSGRATELRCGGCAAKVGPLTLERALARVTSVGGAAAVRELYPGEDAAVIDKGGSRFQLETVDFFRAFWPEPYLLGAVAANHALGDIFAMGGEPEHAVAIAVLPYARTRLVEEDLVQLLAGARATLDREGVALVGGHTSEGQDLSVGFAVSGSVPRERLLLKGGLKPGQHLILTKPIGTGVIFAAEMRGLARAADVASALASMLRSNRAATATLLRFGVTAATDVTGFGLVGHLAEMARASSVRIGLDLARIPILSGAIALARLGIASTLLAENLELLPRLTFAEPAMSFELALLLDPQTAGGVLAGVPANQAEPCLAALRNNGAPEAAIVGEVESSSCDPGGIFGVRGRLSS